MAGRTSAPQPLRADLSPLATEPGIGNSAARFRVCLDLHRGPHRGTRAQHAGSVGPRRSLPSRDRRASGGSQGPRPSLTAPRASTPAAPAKHQPGRGLYHICDPLDANSRRRGRWWSLGQVAVPRRLVEGVPGRLRCCTRVLYGARPGRHAAWLQSPDPEHSWHGRFSSSRSILRALSASTLKQ
jgi:hypothetical protein